MGSAKYFLRRGKAMHGNARTGMANTLHPSGCSSLLQPGKDGQGAARQSMAGQTHSIPAGVLKFADNINNEKHMENTEHNLEVLRLPLWKNCYEEMLRDGVEYGNTYTAEFFEERLKAKRDSMTFGLDISKIRAALLSHGVFLSGRGQKGEQFIIVDAAANTAVMENFQSQAIKALRSGVILGTNTRVDVLTAEERRRHESTLEKLAIRSTWISRKIPTLKKALNSLAA